MRSSLPWTAVAQVAVGLGSCGEFSPKRLPFRRFRRSKPASGLRSKAVNHLASEAPVLYPYAADQLLRRIRAARARRNDAPLDFSRFT